MQHRLPENTFYLKVKDNRDKQSPEHPALVAMACALPAPSSSWKC